MVVFGAGASYDSHRDLPPVGLIDSAEDRPPLASGLFDHRFENIADTFKITADTLKRLADKAMPLEDSLSKLQQEAETNHQSAQQLTAVRSSICFGRAQVGAQKA